MTLSHGTKALHTVPSNAQLVTFGLKNEVFDVFSSVFAKRLN